MDFEFLGGDCDPSATRSSAQTGVGDQGVGCVRREEGVAGLVRNQAQAQLE
jgi:hypothetical protein